MKGDAQPTYSRLPIRHLLQRLIHAPAALAMIWPALLILGGYIAWDRWGAQEIAKKFYGIDASLIHVTQRPEHIASDITEVVYRDTKLDQLSLIDPTATARIASAFSSHPWVSKVIAVRKLPGGQVDVHLQYRVPVAMVYVISRHPDVNGRPGFFAIDEHGVLLPTTEFTREHTMRYIHIEIPDVYPTGGVGSLFGDPRIVGAARLAALILPFRESLDTRSIQVHETSRTSPVTQYQLVTHSGESLLWGSAPGQEIYGERKPDEKIRELINRFNSTATTVSHK
ncbi:MAG TPA: hypothetical protein DDZ51_12395 [Planctomycetaceae bacterium]|nr:hypothetical protein [Planctomycetaceae bacterium]